MHSVLTIFRREFLSYFSTPVAFVFIVVFLFLNGIFTFYMGSFFERNQADLIAFFQFHPFLYLALIPPLAMRLWAEERKTGSIELLMTLPITVGQAVVGKFLAAWLFTGVALALTFPIWVTVNYLGDPDNGVIFASYLGSFLMAGAYLAIGSCVSAMTKNQVIAFVVTAVICFLFVLSGFPLVLNFFHGWLPEVLVEAIASFSFLNRFNSISQGVIDLRDLIYFASILAFWLYMSAVVVERKKAD